ncbi:hypothetical protein D7Y57_04120 [Stenotrophomonas maltophilia]|uniref:hypothetical protein n=1 Tax=Stenotrophomonas maltophilia group TaxID=995085 RepID=UPI00049F3E25|nr:MULTISPECIES: hypothetical protein [Stenotrophomonas]KDE89372.1 hypothetical protein DF40_015095 [Stenotrophomonas maltophilia M30]KOO78263.1 hypothetical protein VO93_06590 [Stenotrophomonas maltophilia]MBA0455327.1 hypothetical protein [Stenotrophomonas maltophilia]MBH1388563.1 hypothetical protein [Stenotrophomonas maltophilia]MBH1621646.1 hypothetical protein [Stenotrophomonas maltophilia]
MSAGTESLIRAIQTNDPLAFYGWLHTLKGTPDLDAGVAGDPGITALGVASVMYAKAIQSDRILAARYAAMIEALMDAGANPLVRIGERFVVRRGHTGKLERRQISEVRSVAEVCGGVLCPAMQAWFARHTADLMNTHLHRYHPAFIKTQQPVAEEV